jgi:hypothetical protein
MRFAVVHEERLAHEDDAEGCCPLAEGWDLLTKATAKLEP